MHIYNIKQMGQLTEANSCEKSAIQTDGGQKCGIERAQF